jgi:hypothetical protein
MKPYYDDGQIQIWHGDCREILPTLSADVLVTDPPYGIRWRTPRGRSRPKGDWSLIGDAVPFDPSHLLELGLPSVIFGANHFADKLPASPGWIVWDNIFGANHFADKLPASPGWIVWDKRHNMPSNDQSDAELAWTNVLGSVRTIRCTTRRQRTSMASSRA